MNVTVQANEFVTLMCAYVLVTFTQFVPDAGSRHVMGWYLSSMVIGLILTNLLLLTF